MSQNVLDNFRMATNRFPVDFVQKQIESFLIMMLRSTRTSRRL